MDDILTRALFALIAGLSGWGVYSFLKSRSLKQARKISTSMSFPTGEPFILYFTTPDCVPCRTVQRPALQSLKTTLGEQFRIVEINAYEHPDLVKQYGILSIPTTFIFDSAGVPRFVNHGVIRKERLLTQLQQVMAFESSTMAIQDRQRAA